LDLNGVPIVGIVNIAPMGEGPPLAAGSFMTRADGAFTTSAVPAGTYKIYVSSVAGELRTASGVVVIAGEDVRDVRLSALARGTARGRVEVETAITGRVQLKAVPADPAQLNDVIAVGEVQDGRFEIAVGPGLQVLRPESLPPGWALDAVLHKDIDVTDAGIDFKSGALTDGIVVKLTANPPRLSGVVNDSKGKLVVAASVVVFAKERVHRNGDWRYFALVRPDQNGSYAVASLAPGEYYAIALAYVDRNTAEDPEFLHTLEKDAVAVSLDRAEQKTVNLRLVE